MICNLIFSKFYQQEHYFRKVLRTRSVSVSKKPIKTRVVDYRYRLITQNYVLKKSEKCFSRSVRSNTGFAISGLKLWEFRSRSNISLYNSASGLYLDKR